MDNLYIVRGISFLNIFLDKTFGFEIAFNIKWREFRLRIGFMGIRINFGYIGFDCWNDLW